MNARDRSAIPERARRLMVAAMTPEQRAAYEESLKPKPELAVATVAPVRKVPLSVPAEKSK